jgi:hypothetical protein
LEVLRYPRNREALEYRGKGGKSGKEYGIGV